MILKNSVFYLLLSVVCLSCIACSPDVRNENRQKKIPQKIISLAPSITEELFLLGLEDKITGVTTYCNRPEAALHKEKVGTVVSVNIEVIFRLDPDIIFASPVLDPKHKTRLEGLGFNIEVFPSPRDFTQMCDQFRSLSRLTGTEEKAKLILKNTEKRLKKIRAARTGKYRPSILVQIGTRPIYVGIPGTFINDFIEFAGGENAASGLKTAIISREEVIRRDPEIIFIVTMGIISEHEKKEWQRFNGLRAVKNDAIFSLSADMVCSATPATFPDTLEIMSAYIESIQGQAGRQN
ncbi:MAG: hypothetical protein A2096_07950 [Spirochaetes bacterium GWF1_41_5]|nr:MAG: hypothetical protein A2096_07950 [Spirochaetes bacterium GWF1_41_5]HBE02217.1 hypothetical protein [Spirochaetia bacterium]